MAFEPNLQADVFLLDELVVGSFVFAMDHISSVKTVHQLWERFVGYRLFDFVFVER